VAVEIKRRRVSESKGKIHESWRKRDVRAEIARKAMMM
jgi:hypothetical protein